jgi:hypothetical protein
MRFAIVGNSPSLTNLALAALGWNGVPGELLSPREALLTLGPGDVALARLDVREELDGIEDGLWALERLEDAGVTVLNRPASLLRAHDKLLTARLLRHAALPHPRTTLVERHAPLPDLDFPTVLKPRFGSWGPRRQALPQPRRARAGARGARLPWLVPQDRRGRAGAHPAPGSRPAPDRRRRPHRRRRQADRAAGRMADERRARRERSPRDAAAGRL